MLFLHRTIICSSIVNCDILNGKVRSDHIVISFEISISLSNYYLATGEEEDDRFDAPLNFR